MKTKACVFCMMFILGLFGVLIVMCFCGHAPLPQRVTDRARSEITGLLVAITVFQQDHGYYPVATNAVGSVSMRNVLPVITADHKSKEALQLNPRMLNYVDINQSRYHNGEYLDPWGTPYNLLLESNKTCKSIIHGSVVETHVKIWSNGVNKINEFGYGDDICSWEDELGCNAWRRWWRKLLKR